MEASWKDVPFGVFHDGKAIGTPLAVMIASVSIAMCVVFCLTLKPYQKDYIAMHGAHENA